MIILDETKLTYGTLESIINELGISNGDDLERFKNKYQEDWIEEHKDEMEENVFTKIAGNG